MEKSASTTEFHPRITMVAVRIHLLLYRQPCSPPWPTPKKPPSPSGQPAPPNHTPAPPKPISPSPRTRLVVGKSLAHLTNIGVPNLAFYPAPANNNTGATIVVFPGGGYRILAYDLEGTEVCTWLNSIGVNCALIKYRVPIEKHFPTTPATSKTRSKPCASRALTPPIGISTHIASECSASPPVAISS